jgi:putative transposase
MSIVYIIKDKSKSKYWNENVKNISSQIWLPELDDSKKENILFSDTWFDATFTKSEVKQPVKIKFPHIMYDKHEESKPIGRKETDVPVELLTRVIPLKFKTKQEVIVRDWFIHARLYYNHAVDYLNNNKMMNFMKLRKIIHEKLVSLYPNVNSSPRDIRDEAVKDAHIAVSNAIKSYRKNNILCKVKFITKKDLNQSIYIPKTAVKGGNIYPRHIGIMRSKKNNTVNRFEDATNACRLVYKRGIGYSLSMPVNLIRNDRTGKGYIALDPGIRTFLTGYSQKGVVEIGKGSISRITRLHKYLDDLLSRITAAPSNQKHRMIKAADRIRNRIKNLIKECHWKTNKYLTTNYTHIIIPPFNTPSMVNRRNRNIRKITVRQMFDWSHYAFRMKLLHQAKKNNCTVTLTNESYTSKTCSNCGYLHEKLAGSKIYNCPSCKVKMDRDINAARGIYLRSLVNGMSNENVPLGDPPL